MIKRLTICAVLSARPAFAGPEIYNCTFGEDGLRMSFALDRAQFAPPQSPRDPPRRQVARLRLRDKTIAAEALLTQGGAVGFASSDNGLMGLVQPDGRASLTENGSVRRGTCLRRPQGQSTWADRF